MLISFKRSKSRLARHVFNFFTVFVFFHLGKAIAQDSSQITSLNIKHFESNNLKENAISIRELGQSYVRVRIHDQSLNFKSESIRRSLSIPKSLLDSDIFAKGPGSTGGGFSYYRGAFVTLTEQLKLIITNLSKMDAEFFASRLPEKYKDTIVKDQLLNYLKNIKYSFFQEGYLISENEIIDELVADYDSNEKQIILLKRFFQTYNQEISSAQSKLAMIRVVLHEITHLFGIGIFNDEDSYNLSIVLLGILQNHNIQCGTHENIVENNLECESRQSVDNSGMRWNLYKGSSLNFPKGSSFFYKLVGELKVNLLTKQNKESEFFMPFQMLLKSANFSEFERLFRIRQALNTDHEFNNSIRIFEREGHLVTEFFSNLPKNIKTEREILSFLEEVCSGIDSIYLAYGKLNWRVDNSSTTRECIARKTKGYDCSEFEPFYCTAILNQ